ncbi:hypothetical protein Asp14428_12350 [Actinoplanes sp. NBRC 14428]|nr:hypothetical protein Asp14428_12350 [Actinoplanes sp. NBRC 14428]
MTALPVSRRAGHAAAPGMTARCHAAVSVRAGSGADRPSRDRNRCEVSADADSFAGEKIDGPFTAYAEAQVIEKHALAASGGKTYAELPKDDPKREVVMTGSFLRSSLFTSVVSFGVAAMAMGLGVLVAIIGYALLQLARYLPAPPVAGTAAD